MPIAQHQAIQLKLADMATRTEAARLLVRRAAELYDRGDRCDMEAGMAKLFATEAAQRCIDRALQLWGGAGLVEDAVVARLYKEVRALRIYEGTSEIQRLVIARAELS